MTTVIAGTGVAATTPPAVGATLVATSTRPNGPKGVAVDRDGNVYIADGGDRVVEKVAPNGDLTVVAGDGLVGGVPLAAGTATTRALSSPSGIDVDADGNLCIADAGLAQVVRVTPGGQLTVVAGAGPLTLRG